MIGKMTMTGFSDKLRLKEQAEEDIYFARRDRELLEALHRSGKGAVAPRFPVKVVSGGQTGVDRAALDAALQRGLEAGGWCPRGRRAEDGRVDARYPLEQTPSHAYGQRTEWNVRDSDATLILHRGGISGGTALTARMARQYGRALLTVDLARAPGPEEVRRWVLEHRVRVLNVAGPRESGAPGIQVEAEAFLLAVFADADAAGSTL
jgi:hypothetical protein